MAARMLMPARIMTASWLVKLCMSLAPGPKLIENSSALFLPTASPGARARMYSPRARKLLRRRRQVRRRRSIPACTLPAAERDS